jgi:DNA-binding CsgD family transcriptional regulator
MSNAVAASSRLRVAITAADPARASRLAALITEFGHEVVEPGESPDACLTEGAGNALAVPTVALGSSFEEIAGRLPSNATAIQIDAALRAVAAGLTVRAATPPDHRFEPLPEDAPVLLTPREIEVLAALGRGLSNKGAARQLGISPHTVKFHVESLFRKLGAASRAEAVAKGLKQQIVEL